MPIESNGSSIAAHAELAKAYVASTMRRSGPVWRFSGPIRSCVYIALALSLGAGSLARAQMSQAAATSSDTSTLGRVPFSRMHTKLEKTIFKVDVLNLDVWLGDVDADRIAELVGGSRYTRELADSVADVAIHSQDAYVRIEFLRNVGLEQFLGGVDDNLRRVLEAGIIERADYEMISEGLPRWFGFLEERGIHKGDQILYRIRGDALTTRFVAASGEILLDQTDVGPERRLAVLGSYFVRGSDFRKGLVRSLFQTPE